MALMSTSNGGDNTDDTTMKHQQHGMLPKVIVFDLDGCLWKPEMYELLYFSGGFGAPFSIPKADASAGDDDSYSISTLLTCKGEPVNLMSGVVDVFRELYTDSKWKGNGGNDGVRVGISSRTDQPDWARELLQKFQVSVASGSSNSDDSTNPTTSAATRFSLRDVIDSSIIEISHGSKVNHFQNIQRTTGIDYNEMVFFDNEYGNCEQISEQLGVIVGYCPRTGVTKEIWDKTLQAYDTRRRSSSGGSSSSIGGQIIQV